MKKAFTLIELLIVIVVIGIMAAFGAANFAKSLFRAKARDAINNLSIIHAANMMYKARNGVNCSNTVPPHVNECSDITGINSMNGENSLNIIAGSLFYKCGEVSGKGECHACSSNAFPCQTSATTAMSVTVKLDEAIVQGSNPECASYKAGDCP